MHTIVVTAQSFSRHETLCAELEALALEHEFRVIHASFDSLCHDDQVRILKPAKVWVVGKEPVTQALIDQLPELAMVCKYGVGKDNVDEGALATRRVTLGWKGGVNADSVAEFSIGLMISLLHRVAYTSSLMRRGVWQKRGGVDLRGRMVGVVGAGAVGSRVLKLAAALGCRVCFTDILAKKDLCAELSCQQIGLKQLLKESDVVSIHVPLTAETRGMIGSSELELIGPESFLINTARGEVAETDAVVKACRDGIIAGAAMDVYSKEPFLDGGRIDHPNVLATPHIAGNSAEAVLNMGRAALSSLKEYLSGHSP